MNPAGDNGHKPIAVGVLVDLAYRAGAGGQVKCWERLAEAAALMPDEVDLTLHFQGPRETIIVRASNVRYITLPPVLSTVRFQSMKAVADHTDLSPLLPKLVPYLKHYEVIHTTDAFFAQARTALLVSGIRGVPLVHSIHTDTPRYTRLYSKQIIGELVRRESLQGLLLNRLRLHRRLESLMTWRLSRFLRRCRWVFVSREEDRLRVSRILGQSRVSRLRRGVDKTLFHPKHRNRERLTELLGVPEDRFVLLFAGRVDAGKNVMTLARAARKLLDEERPIHVLVAGEGSQSGMMKDLLGSAVTLAGTVPQEQLALMYASSDAFVFPSEVEVCPNVVLEARSSGLPVLIPAWGGAVQLVTRHKYDGWLVPGSSPMEWVDALRHCLDHRKLTSRMGRRARHLVETAVPAWDEVLQEDLLPVWRFVARVDRRS